MSDTAILNKKIEEEENWATEDTPVQEAETNQQIIEEMGTTTSENETIVPIPAKKITVVGLKQKELTQEQLEKLDKEQAKFDIDLERINKEKKKEVSLEVQQDDESNPLFSHAYTWGTLKKEAKVDPKIYLGISKQSWKYPSSIQFKSIPFILDPKNKHMNLIAQSQSGTGKTGCFVVAALQAVDTSINTTQAIILAPTLEIAFQIHDVLKKISHYMADLTSRLIRKQEKYKKLSDHILVATPGSLQSLIRKKKVDTSQVKVLILDEADEFLNNVGTRKTDQVLTIKERLPKNIRILLFSATYMDIEDQTDSQREAAAEVRAFVDSFVTEPVHKILVKKEDLSLKNMRQYAIHCPGSLGKAKAMVNIIENVDFEKMVVFVNSTDGAIALCNLVQQQGISAAPLAGKIDAETRIDTTKKFLDGEIKVLVATNVFARGVDVRFVTHVINYDMPIIYNTRNVDKAVYIHRVGRTARFGTNGTAINLVNGDVEIQAIKELEAYYKIDIKYIEVDFDEDSLNA